MKGKIETIDEEIIGLRQHVSLQHKRINNLMNTLEQKNIRMKYKKLVDAMNHSIIEVFKKEHPMLTYATIEKFRIIKDKAKRKLDAKFKVTTEDLC